VTPALLTQTGTALFGAEFRPQLAAALGVDARAVRRWCAGTAPVPAGVAAELRDLIRARLAELRAAFAALSL
jgi:hypothetical protein